MCAVPFIGSVIPPARTVGGGAGPGAPADEHGFPQIIVGRCSRYRSATLPLDATTRQTLAACGVARYSEP